MLYHNRSKTIIEGLSVEVKEGKFEKALRTFSKKVQNSGKLREYKERQEYLKPSIVKNKKRKAAVKRQKLEAASVKETF